MRDSRIRAASYEPVPDSSVLVISRDPHLLELLERGLGLAGYAVRTGTEGGQVLRAAVEEVPDVVVLDADELGVDELGVIGALRGSGSALPLCVLSQRDSVSHRIASFDRGADDYVVKPVAVPELTARLGALLRRARELPRLPRTLLSAGPLVMDLGGRRVTVDGHEIRFTKRQFDVLEQLLRGQGEVQSRQRLLAAVWGYDFAADTNIIDVVVGVVRRKLAEAGAPPMIHTVRGIGHVLRAPE